MRISVARLLATAAFTISLTTGAVQSTFMASDTAMAATPAKTAVGKLSAPQMMAKMEQSLLLMANIMDKLPKAQKSKSAGFTKALVDAAKSLGALKKAADKKDQKALAKSLPQAASSISKLTNAYKLSGMQDKALKTALTTLNDVWKDYLLRTPGSKTAATKEQATQNARRIAGMKKQLTQVKSKSGLSVRDKQTIAELERLLAQAEAANRSAANQWLAVLLFADAYGYYSGYYDYLVVYDPTYVVYYTDSYSYFTSEYNYSYTEYYSYYESYEWSYYEQSVDVYDAYDFNMTPQDYAAFETTYESSYTSFESTTINNYEQAPDVQEIGRANEVIEKSSENMADTAQTPDPAVDNTVDVIDDNTTPDTILDNETQSVDAPADNADTAPDANAPPAEEPLAEAPPAEEPQAEAPPAEEPQAEAPPAEEPQADAPPAEEPQAEAPPAEEPQADAPPAEEPQADAPPAEEPQAEEPPAEEPQAEEPPAEEPQAEEPPAEEPQAEEPPADDGCSDPDGCN